MVDGYHGYLQRVKTVAWYLWFPIELMHKHLEGLCCWTSPISSMLWIWKQVCVSWDKNLPYRCSRTQSPSESESPYKDILKKCIVHCDLFRCFLVEFLCSWTLSVVILVFPLLKLSLQLSNYYNTVTRSKVHNYILYMYNQYKSV